MVAEIVDVKEEKISKVFSENDVWAYIKTLEDKVDNLSLALKKSVDKNNASEAAVTEGFRKFLSQKGDIVIEEPKPVIKTGFTKENFEEVSTMLSNIKIDIPDEAIYECESGTKYNVTESLDTYDKSKGINDTVEFISEISPQEVHFVNESYGYMIPDKKVFQVPDPDYFESEVFKQLKLSKLVLQLKCEWCNQHADHVQFKCFDNVKDATPNDLWALCTWHYNECHKLENSETSNFKINWKLESPNGFIFHLSNLPKFSESNLLHSATLGMVARGTRTHHKGWNCNKYDGGEG